MDSTNSSGVTDDQELAKVLEGMNQAAPITDPPTNDVSATDATASDVPVQETPETIEGLTFEPTAVPSVEAPTIAPPAEPTPASAPTSPLATSASPELESIKKTALEELRPLVDKLDLPADEKFDTLLLLIRSTDDKTLVSAAHEAAKAITDETKRAQALLDVIKEIDYFSGNAPQPQ